GLPQPFRDQVRMSARQKAGQRAPWQEREQLPHAAAGHLKADRDICTHARRVRPAQVIALLSLQHRPMNIRVLVRVQLLHYEALSYAGIDLTVEKPYRLQLVP